MVISDEIVCDCAVPLQEQAPEVKNYILDRLFTTASQEFGY
jgi:hypothetical protein